MKHFTLTIRKMLLFFAVSVFTASLFAQGDTLRLTTNDDLYGTISSDTLSGGEQAHKVYLLPRGGVFFMAQTLVSSHGFELVGEPGPEETFPAYILPSKNESGGYNYFYVESWGTDQEYVFKNLIIQGWTQDAESSGTIKPGFFSSTLQSLGTRLIVDNCIINGFEGAIGTKGTGTYVKITNSLFRNITNSSADWFGMAIDDWESGWRDSLIVQNCTFMNIGCTAIYPFLNQHKAVVIDHNTFIGSRRMNIFTGFQTDVTITNNIFTGGWASGYSQDYRLKDPGAWDYNGVINVAPITDPNTLAILADEFGLDTSDVEAQRKFIVTNNVNWYPEFLVQAWDTLDYKKYNPNTCDPQVWIKDTCRNQFNRMPESVVEDALGHLNSDEAKGGTFDPGFDMASVESVYDAIIQWTAVYRNDDGFIPYHPNFDAEGKRYQLSWPLPEDFSYTNTDMLTYSTTGGPVGDLNWFGGPTGIRDSRAPRSMELSVFPNPFTSSTTIRYRVEEYSHVRLSIFDLSGKELAVLANTWQVAGEHSVQWKGTRENGLPLGGGIYICKIQSGSQSAVRKVILME